MKKSSGYGMGALIAVAVVLAGCAMHPDEPRMAAANPPAAAPLNLCAAPKAPPTPKQQGYVELQVSVTDAGAPVKGLKPDDFVVYSGSQRFPIASVRNLSGTPSSLVIAIDTTGSMQPKLETVQKTLGGFLKSLNACDEVAIISFGASGERHPDSPSITLIQPFTTDHALAASRLEALKPYGQTALFDAVDKGLQILSDAHYPNRSMLLITDGMDNISVTRGDDVVVKARSDGWPVYAIGIGDPHAEMENTVAIGPFLVGGSGADRVDPVFLKELASASGGQAFIVPEFHRDDGKGFNAAIDTIEPALGNGYVIGFAPAGNSGSATNLPTVAVPSHPGAVIKVNFVEPRTVASATP